MNPTREFTWAVDLHGYDFFELRPEDNERPGLVITGRTVTRELRYYTPLSQFPGLYRTFSSLEEGASAVRAFADQYGLLGGEISGTVPVTEEPAPYRRAIGE